MEDNRTGPAGEPAGAQAGCETSSPPRILVVEDDVDLRRLNTEVLTRSGYHVDAAEDGAAGWEALREGDYDLLITDNGMPRLTGVGLLKKLRAARMVLPVIMATAALPAHVFAQSPWLVPDATLLKPFTSDELLGTVEKILRVTGGDHEAVELLPIRRNRPSADGLRS